MSMTFGTILIIVTGLSIGVVGILIIAVFIWLQRRHVAAPCRISVVSSSTPSSLKLSLPSPTIPCSPLSGIGPSVAHPLSNGHSTEASWDNVIIYNLEGGGEGDNEAFDREAIQIAVPESGERPPPGYVPDLESSVNAATDGSTVLRDNRVDRTEQMTARVSSEGTRAQPAWQADARTPLSDVGPSRTTRTTTTAAGAPQHGRGTSVTRDEPANCDRYSEHIYAEVNSSNCSADNDDHLQRERQRQIDIGDGPTVFTGTPTSPADRSPLHCGGSGETRPKYAQTGSKLVKGNTGASNLKATSFKDANPVTLILSTPSPAKDTLQTYETEGDLSLASLSTLISDQSDASITLTPLRLTLRPTREEESSEEMFI